MALDMKDKSVDLDQLNQQVCRSVQFRAVSAADSEDDGLTLEGYGAVFDQPTEINSWEGTFNESIRKGAFRKTIRERTPVMQFDHGHHPMIGSIPLGRIKQLSEDDQGLFVRARLSDNWLIQPIRDAIRDRAVDGMSFRFDVVRDEWRDDTGKKITSVDDLMAAMSDPERVVNRTLIEVRLYEVGPVVFPAYPTTSVGVRSAVEALQRNREVIPDLARALFVLGADHPHTGLPAAPVVALLNEAKTDSANPARSDEQRGTLDTSSETESAPLATEPHPDEETRESGDDAPAARPPVEEFNDADLRRRIAWLRRDIGINVEYAEKGSYE